MSFKYYKAELNGEVLDIRASKRDYTVAMVVTMPWGASRVESMNAAPRTKASVLAYFYRNRAVDATQMEDFNNTTVQAVPLTLATKAEHEAVKAARAASRAAYFAKRIADKQAAQEAS